jgi:hypothetical protein
MQSPLAYKYLKAVGFPLPEEAYVPQIVTGLEALGRIGDLDKIKQFTEMMQLPQAWPIPVQERTKWDVYAKEVAAGLSMKMPWIMTDEEYQAKQQQQAKAQQEAMAAQAMAGAAEKAGPDMINKAMQ